MTKTILLPGMQDNGPAYAVSFQGKTKQAIDQARKDGSLSAVQMPDGLAQRQALAKKQAHKIVSDAFGGEKKMDANVQSIRDHSDSLRRDNLTAGEEIDAMKSLIADARKQHGIEEGSEEEREIELLRRADSLSESASTTDEERAEAEAIRMRGLTQSQKDFLEHTMPYYDRIDGLEKQIDQNDAVIQANNAAERQIRIERLKTDPIGDAQEEADAILDEANQDVISTLFDEAKDHIDEEKEKTEEAAEEKAEEEAEKQEKIDAVRERKAEQEALTEAIREKLQENENAGFGTDRATEDQGSPIQEILNGMNTKNLAAPDLSGVKETQDQIKAKVNEVLDRLKLLPEDIKGTKVNDIV